VPSMSRHDAIQDKCFARRPILVGLLALLTCPLLPVRRALCVLLEYCRECKGSGKCWRCGGTGGENCNRCNGTGEVAGARCPICRGKGLLKCIACDGAKKCFECNGTGKDDA
jgi:hypothetical protein